jgi:deoxyribodipyrimidine photolyase-related protein
MTATLRVVLGDQLSDGLSALHDLDAAHDVVLMAEVADETRYVRHHRQKVVLVLSAMRHFAAALRARGITVRYVLLDDPANTGSLSGELQRAVRDLAPARIVATEPGEWRVLDLMRGWEAACGLPVELRDDDRFLCSRAQFRDWLAGRSAPRMEFFYREMRRRTGFLMDGDQPVGGAWNFDTENRKRLPKGLPVPPARRFEPDAVTREVIALVAARCADHFGALEPFGWAVTREQALEALHDFVHELLPSFGDYQDAMRAGEPFLFHAVLSPYLNVGLLLPREVCEAALAAGERGAAPLNAVEGFLRQVLGWREYVRGLYWTQGPGYGRSNALAATRPLPAFFWTRRTDLACVAAVLEDTWRHAYAHHIERLMVIGNFALLAGLAPAAVEEWFLVVYADAFEWVELPNVHGMALYADGGLLASKPYAASGAYIDRMSDHCRGCRYDPKQKEGETACPFNYLYWEFLLRNEGVLGDNPRLSLPYRNLAGMTAGRRARIRADAGRFLSGLSGEQGGG